MNELDRRQQGDSSGNWYVMTLAVTKGAILGTVTVNRGEHGRVTLRRNPKSDAGRSVS